MHASSPSRFTVVWGILTTGLLSVALSGQQPGGPPPREASPLRFRYMGPASSGRISAVAGIPGNIMTYYAGAASGGIWKTTDGGRTFTPIFDDEPVQAIGALAIAPSDSDIIWAGTGEAWVIRPTDVMGDGIYKSVDAGRTWKKMGLTETGRIARVVVHPTNPNIVFACALGRATGPQQERGVYRTIDGGGKWERVLFVDPDTGCSGMVMDPNNPNVLLAGTWQVVMHTWGMFSGGPGSGVYQSRDGGTTWKKLENGLPKPPVGKIDVAIAPTNSRRMFALIQTADQGSLWRSDDAGGSWKAVSWDRRLIGRAGYYIRVTVSPGDENEVLVANSSFHRSLDGGRTFIPQGGGCGDCHDIWMDPSNPDHYVTTGDQGMGITTTHGRTFNRITLPIGQMYHVAVDNRVPYWIYSNRQDDGTMRGPSDSPVAVANVPSYAASFGGGGGRGSGGGGGGGPEGAGRGGAAGQEGGGRGVAAPGGPAGGPATATTPGPQGAPEGGPAGGGLAGVGFGGGGGRGGGGGDAWQQGIGGCESGFTIPDLVDPDIIWATCYGNEVTRFDSRLRRARSVSPWIHTLDSEPTKTKYRCHWTPPLALDPFDQKTVYYGCQVIFKTSNGGQTWDVISPDLSTQDPSRIVSSGGVIGDNLGQFYGEVVFAIAPSPIQKGLIWAGTNDGKVWYTKDAGGKWIDVTKNVTGMPEWGTITKIEPSHFDPATAYMVVDYHIMDNRDPFIYKTTDFGQTWTKISDRLPKGPLSYAISLAENPNRKGMLFAGTGNGFYYSLDDGKSWTQFKEGLPAAPVTWIVVQKQYHDVVISTYGRGLYILSDITPLEQSDQGTRTTDAQLFAPRPGFRLSRSGRADFNFSLKAPSAQPLAVEILNPEGTVIRKLQLRGGAGLNRASWDLRYEPPQQVALRTIPPDNPHIWDEPRFRDLKTKTRPIIHWGIAGPQRSGPLAAPGRYTVRLTVNGKTQTQPFDVVKDPQLPSSDEDIRASTKMQIRIRDDMNATVEMVNRIEVMRKQIEDLVKDRSEDDVRKALLDLDKKMLDVELLMLSRTDMHSDDKWYVEAYKIYMNLIWLNGVVGTGAGDVAGGADYRPTDASLAVLETIEKDLADAKAAFTRLMEKEVPAFNQAMSGKGIPPINVNVTTSSP